MGQVLGDGCLYPASTLTLADQLSTQKLGGWKAYVEGIDKGPKATSKTCRHPFFGVADGEQAPRPDDPYVTWRNPFVYFHSLVDGAPCAAYDVGLSQLAADLKSPTTTPALSYIVPSPCDDGDPEPCTPHAPAGLRPAAKFLQTVLPEIERSPAYRADGIIAVTFDQAPQSGPHADQTACCDPQTFPNLGAGLPAGGTTTASAGTTIATTTTTPTRTAETPSLGSGETVPTGGGGQVGLLLISKYVKAGKIDTLDYFNHFSLLATIEDIFGVRKLGYASDPQLQPFDASVFDNVSGT
jgi:hypothetical protein